LAAGTEIFGREIERYEKKNPKTKNPLFHNEDGLETGGMEVSSAYGNTAD